MEVLLINGSPKKHGNTAQVLEMVASELTSKGHEADLHHIVDYDVQGCNGCYACQKTHDFPGCVIDDEHHMLRDLMVAADAILIGSPLYMWGFTSQIKAFFDRHICLVNRYHQPGHSSLLDGKPYALLMTLGGPVENNAEGALTAYERITGHIKVNNLGAFTLPGCSSKGELPEAASDLAKQIAEKLAGVG